MTTTFDPTSQTLECFNERVHVKIIEERQTRGAAFNVFLTLRENGRNTGFLFFPVDADWINKLAWKIIRNRRNRSISRTTRSSVPSFASDYISAFVNRTPLSVTVPFSRSTIMSAINNSVLGGVQGSGAEINSQLAAIQSSGGNNNNGIAAHGARPETNSVENGTIMTSTGLTPGGNNMGHIGGDNEQSAILAAQPHIDQLGTNVAEGLNTAAAANNCQGMPGAIPSATGALDPNAGSGINNGEIASTGTIVNMNNVAVNPSLSVPNVTQLMAPNMSGLTSSAHFPVESASSIPTALSTSIPGAANNVGSVSIANVQATPAAAPYNNMEARQQLMALDQYMAAPGFPQLGEWRTDIHDIFAVRGPAQGAIEAVMCVVVGVISREKAFLGTQGTFNPRFSEPMKNAKAAKWQFTLECPEGDAAFAPDWPVVMDNLENMQGQVARTPDKRHLILPGRKLRVGRPIWELKSDDNNTAACNAFTNNYPINNECSVWWGLMKATHQISPPSIYNVNGMLNMRAETWERDLVGAKVELTFSVKHYYMGPTSSRPEPYDVFSACIESISILVAPPPVVRSPYKKTMSPTKPRATPQTPTSSRSHPFQPGPVTFPTIPQPIFTPATQAPHSVMPTSSGPSTWIPLNAATGSPMAVQPTVSHASTPMAGSTTPFISTLPAQTLAPAAVIQANSFTPYVGTVTANHFAAALQGMSSSAGASATVATGNGRGAVEIGSSSTSAAGGMIAAPSGEGSARGQDLGINQVTTRAARVKGKKRELEEDAEEGQKRAKNGKETE